MLLAFLSKNKEKDIEIKTGAHAAMKGFKIPFTPSELEKKDNT